MDVIEILQAGGTALLIIVLTLIKIPKLEINVGGLIGRAINKEQTAKIDNMQKSIDGIQTKLDEHIKDEEEYRAEDSRRYILQGNEEIMRDNARHSKEWFDNLLGNIDEYEDYCDSHPSYKNNKADLAIQNIKHVYQRCLDEHTFLSF